MQQYTEASLTHNCPYIGTIRRHFLDFDFQKVCSVSLSSSNIYSCLVCGRYFQGKSTVSPVYQHSIETNHHLFISIKTARVFCLPDDYEVLSHTFQDVQYNLLPVYDSSILKQIYSFQKCYNSNGREFIPGVIGLNNLVRTDYANCVFQLLNCVSELREYFLFLKPCGDDLLDATALLLKKMWNRNNFKGVVNPHQLMQTITQLSHKTYKIGKKGDPANFLVWMLDNLQKRMRKIKSHCKLLDLFQGKLKMSYVKAIVDSVKYEQAPTQLHNKNFIYLKMQFPHQGIFNKTQNQVHIDKLLQQYTAQIGKKYKQGLMFIKVTNCSRYLLLVFQRFKKTEYKVEIDSSQLQYTGQMSLIGYSYQLLAQICHEGTYENGVYKLYGKIREIWYMFEDTQVTEVIKKQMLLGSPYLQLYIRKQ